MGCDPAPAGTGSLAREANSRCLFCGEKLGNEAEVEAEDWFFRAVPGRFGFARCDRCASLVLADPLRPDLLPLAYAQYYTHGDTGTGRDKRGGLKSHLRNAYLRRRFGGRGGLVTALGAAAYRLTAPNRQETELHYRCLPPAPAAVLDYGCGDGEFLARIRALGYEATGIDMDAKAVANARSKGIEVYLPGEVGDGQLQGRFDAVTLAHVIEHVPDPGALLKQIHGWLRPGGLLYIEAPSANAHGLEIFGTYWRGLEAPRHLVLPSIRALTDALREAGFCETRQYLRKSVRFWLWAESIGAAPDSAHEELKERMQAAPAETPKNADFITLLARRTE